MRFSPSSRLVSCRTSNRGHQGNCAIGASSGSCSKSRSFALSLFASTTSNKMVGDLEPKSRRRTKQPQLTPALPDQNPVESAGFDTPLLTSNWGSFSRVPSFIAIVAGVYLSADSENHNIVRAGSSVDLRKRWKKHLENAKDGTSKYYLSYPERPPAASAATSSSSHVIRVGYSDMRGPLTPLGGLTGVLVVGNPGWGWVFRLARVVTCTPQKYAQSTQLVERNHMTFSVFEFFKIFSRFFSEEALPVIG